MFAPSNIKNDEMNKKIIFEVPYSKVLNDLRLIFKEERHEPPKKSTIENRTRLLTLSETAEFFQVSKKTIYNWNRNHILKRIQVGNRIFFEWNEIQKMLEKNKI